MKRAFAIIAALALMGAVRSQAQTTNVVSEEDITLKGKLIPDGTLVTGESLSGNTNNISILVLEIINGSATNTTVVIGQAAVTEGVTNVVPLLAKVGVVDLTPTTTTSDKVFGVYGGSSGTASNATLFLTTTEKLTGSTVTLTGKFQGIWNDGVDAVSGTLASVKPKK
jgi:hypothetical protein